MKEDFLHYLWQYQLFSSKKLITVNENTVTVVKVGEQNHNAGPDFFNAQLRIDNQRWAGNVEIHVKSSDWYVHGHENDKAYDNVILHVVWEYDVDIYRKDNSTIPTLELKGLIDKGVHENYQKLFTSTKKWINCEEQIHTISNFQLSNWLEKLYIERLEQKASLIEELLTATKNDWEAVLFILLSKNFGLNINGQAFLDFAKSLDFTIVRKLQNNQLALEALFFGHSGFLNDDAQESYLIELQNEYKYLVSKYNLKSNYQFNFQFFRLRPNNFPTIRLAQLSSLLYHQHNIFSKIMEIENVNDYYNIFNIPVSEFWKTHYSFTSLSKNSNKKITKSLVHLFLINTIIPLKFAYLKHIGKLNVETIFETIKVIPSEKNTIIEKFSDLKIVSNNAMESQSLIQMKNEYCSKLKCLECSIGNFILKDG